MEKEGILHDKDQCMKEEQNVASSTLRKATDSVPSGSDTVVEPSVGTEALQLASEDLMPSVIGSNHDMPQGPSESFALQPLEDNVIATEVASPTPKEMVAAGQSHQGVDVDATSIIDPQTSLEKPPTHSHQLSDMTTSSTISIPASLGSEAKVDENLDELVGLGDNVIVERSPGSRYVRFMEKLGSGASKDVYRAYDTQEGIEVAWNVVNLLGIPKTDRNRIVNEVRLLEQLHHQNIISFHGSWVNRERQEVIFVTEILSSGTLKSFIKKVQVIRWKIAKRWAVQILNGLEYLHSRNPPVIHRDLKCENIFINGASGDLRIGDFGLSTLYRNGTVRSVLGTPEFMAPDMYEETSYDEKVDIYAFGMCLLEIFTKEIPYAECSNPAQIYKKVSAGEPPEVLSRLQSHHAREFVELCLGRKDEITGRFIRPTATELLTHPFLMKRASDDDEVGVEPPLRERGILEDGESQSTSPPVSGGKSRSPAQTESDQMTQGTSNCKPQHVWDATTGKASVATTRARVQSVGSFDDDECDRFEQMPESEVNIRNVKVFMGRGQELRDEQVVSATEPTNERTDEKTTEGIAGIPCIAPQVATSSATSPLSMSTMSLVSNITDGLSLNIPQYPIVSGGTATGDNASHTSDVRQFVITLPLDGQTQNIQFDFHLLHDDPIQVTNEMVTELGLPPESAHGIATIIKSLANEARGNRSVDPPTHQNVLITESGQPLYVNSQPLSDPLPSQPNVQLAPGQQNIAGATVLPHPNPGAAHHSHGVMQTRIQDNGAMVPLVTTNQPTVPVNPSATSVVSQVPSQVTQATFQTGHVYQTSVQPVQPNNLIQHNEAVLPPVTTNQQTLPLNPSASAGSDIPLQVTQPTSQGGPFSKSSAHPGTQLPLSHSAPVHAAATLNPSHLPLTSMAPTVSSHPPTVLVQDIPMTMAHERPLPQCPTQDFAAVPHVGLATNLLPATEVRNGSFLNSRQLPHPAQEQLISPPQALVTHKLHAVQPQNLDMQGSRNTSAFQSTSSSNQLPSMPVGGATLLSEVNSAVISNAPVGLPIRSLDAMGNVDQRQTGVVVASTEDIPDERLQAVYPSITHYAPSIGISMNVPNSVTPTQPSFASLGAPVDYTIPQPLPMNGDLMHPQQQTPPFSINPAHFDAHRQSDEVLWSAQDDSDNLSDDDVVQIANELRKLDEDYQKNLLRTKKVFDSRMDNLQRTLIEREVQHQRTVEKHEKDRVAFERRVQQEELEHNRRVEQLQREWDEKRERLARQKQLGGLRSRKPSTDGVLLPPAVGTRSHSTSPILNPERMVSTYAHTSLDNLNDNSTRPPVTRGSSLPKLD